MEQNIDWLKLEAICGLFGGHRWEEWTAVTRICRVCILVHEKIGEYGSREWDNARYWTTVKRKQAMSQCLLLLTGQG